jgi:hypothetical protein
MKKVLMVSLFALVTIVSFGQEEEVVPDLIPYEDAASKLFISKVIEVPNKTQKELATQFKNWASTSFVNLREIIVSETDNQIVLNYITRTNSYFKTLGMKNPVEYSWYVRLVAQFKDGKIRVQFYDDGNVFRPGEYLTYARTTTPSTPARSMFISAVTIKPESYKELHRTKYFYDLHYQWQQNISNMTSSCEKGMKDINLIAKKDDF